MATKYIVDNLTGQTITGDLTINGNLTVTGTSNNSGTYRALLTQTGSLNGDSSYFNNRLIIGETYEITDYQNYDDFSNVANVISGGTFIDFDKGSTSRSQGYATAIRNYLLNMEFDKASEASNVTVQFNFKVN